MSLGLGEKTLRPELDAFLHREGYETGRRMYQPVLRCWCGSSNLAPAWNGLAEFEDYQVCQSCECLLLKFVLSDEHLAELYGPRFFREVQIAIGHPPFQQRYENDAHDRIPVWIEIVRRHVPKGRVLEVGCGHGRFLKELSALGYQVMGLELDVEIAAWAREKTGVDIRGQRLETLNERDFDVVFSSDVLEHVYNPREFIESAVRATKVGGITLQQTVIFENWRTCPPGFLRPVYHTILYSRRSLDLLPPANACLVPPVPGPFGCDIVGFLRTQ